MLPSGFFFGLQLLDDLHLLQVHDADRVVAGVRRVELLEFRNVLDAFRTRRISDGRDDFIRAEVDDVGLLAPRDAWRSGNGRPHRS